MKKLFGVLFVLIAASTGCATDDAAPPRVSLTTVANEDAAMGMLDELASQGGEAPGISERTACDTGGGHGICCFEMPDGSIPCVAW